MAKIVMEQGALPAAPAAGKTAIAVDPGGQLAAVSDAGTTLLVQSKTVDVSAAELLALNTSPKELIAAPGPGKLIWPSLILYAFSYGGTAYTTNVGIKATLATVSTGQAAILDATADSFMVEDFTTEGFGVESLYATADVADEALVLTNGDGNPETGNGTLRVTVFYVVLDVS